jgi:hypothetical protein
MAEAQKEVRAYRVYFLCEQTIQRGNTSFVCSGHLEFTGMARASLPAQYQNKCNQCGHTEWHRKSYPTIEYREVGGE